MMQILFNTNNKRDINDYIWSQKARNNSTIKTLNNDCDSPDVVCKYVKSMAIGLMLDT